MPWQITGDHSFTHFVITFCCFYISFHIFLLQIIAKSIRDLLTIEEPDWTRSISLPPRSDLGRQCSTIQWQKSYIKQIWNNWKAVSCNIKRDGEAQCGAGRGEGPTSGAFVKAFSVHLCMFKFYYFSKSFSVHVILNQFLEQSSSAQ